MTEIKIEKKKTIWPWILLGLIILAIVIYFLFFTNKLVAPPVTDTVTVPAMPVIAHKNDTVTDYVNFIKTDAGKMALDHSYSSQALMKLVAATRAQWQTKPATM